MLSVPANLNMYGIVATILFKCPHCLKIIDCSTFHVCGGIIVMNKVLILLSKYWENDGTFKFPRLT